jgi:DNA polymerase-3 subunit alpha
LWERFRTNTTTDFMLDEETGRAQAEDQATVIVGGMIADKNIKYTRNDKVMAFLTLEDLVGSVEVVVFPKDYEKFSALLTEDAKIFVKGRASMEEEKDGKVLCEQIVSFEEAAQNSNPFRRRFDGGFSRNNAGGPHPGTGAQAGSGSTVTGSSQSSKVPEGVWIQFADMAAYQASEKKILEAIADSDGTDRIIIYIRNPKTMKVLPPNLSVRADAELAERLYAVFGKENVKFVTKPIENKQKID